MHEKDQLKGDRQTGKSRSWLELGGVNGTVVRLTWDRNHRVSRAEPGPGRAAFALHSSSSSLHCRPGL